MARVKYGAIITEIRGKIGGTVFQSNKYGYSAKNTPCIKRPNSQSVFESQRFLSEVTKYWSTMSDADRLAYDNFASSYPQYAHNNPSAQLSGYAIFVMWQATRLNFGEPIQIPPTTIPPVFPSISPGLRINLAQLELNIFESSVEIDCLFGVSISPPVRASLNYPPSSCRFITNSLTDLGWNDVSTQYLAVFGTLPPVGSTVFLKAVPYSESTPMVLASQFFKLTIA